MGKPRYITFLLSRVYNSAFIIPMNSRRTDIGMCSIPPSVYKYHGHYAVEGSRDLTNQILSMCDASGRSIYAVNAEPSFLNNAMAGKIRGLQHTIRIKNTVLHLDLMTAEPADINLDHIFTFGGYRLS